MIKLFSKLMRFDKRVGLGRLSRPQISEESVCGDDACDSAGDLVTNKQDILSKAKNQKLGDSWRGQTLKGRHQRESRVDIKRQELRDKALQTGVWTIDTY